jgi:hypothetical protein
MVRAVLLALAALCLTACGSTGGPVTSPSPPSTPPPSPAEPLSGAQLRYRLVDELGRPWFCDPDEYPVGRDELAAMRERFGEIEADGATIGAIRSRLDLTGVVGELTDDQRLAIYREWKVLNAIALEPIGNGRYRFDLLTRPLGAADEGRRTAGTIDEHGSIVVEQQVAAGEPICPICLAPATLISTPDGPRPVTELRPGDPIWTTDGSGLRVRATALLVGSVVAPPAHRLVELVMADGRSVRASPGHPLADGRAIGDLRAGDTVDGSTVVAANLIASGPTTSDVLPSGPTGMYWADGILLRSTLRP